MSKGFLGSKRGEERGGDYFPLHEMGDVNSPSNSNNNNYRPTLDDNETFLENSNQFVPAIHNLDNFLTDVYNYFTGKGFWCIVFDQLFELLTSLFVIVFFTFLVSFINYDILFSSNSSLANAIDYNRKVPGWLTLFLILFSIYWLAKFFRFLTSIRTTLEIRSFYHNTLHISEDDIQTIQWRSIVNKLVAVPRLCRVKDDMNALDIANRIMRKENYIIGMIDRKIFDLSIPFPFLRKYKFITKTLEWSIMYALFNHIFDSNGVVKEEYLDVTKRERLARGLSRRFRTIGIIGFFASPFVLIFLLITYFFKYAEEIKNRPGSLGSREWSPLAKWKFREFNELPHYFNTRLNLSYSHANKYVESFPSELISVFAKFVSFLLGAILAVFIVFSVISDDFLFSFDIYGRTPIWYVGIFGTALAICKSLVPDENIVFQPARQMAKVVTHTHYIPKSWRGKTHTYAIRDQFLKLFEYRIVDFIREISSVIFAPFILFFSLPHSSYAILEFIGTYTVNFEGVGYICVFGTFTNLSRYGGSIGDIAKKSTKKSVGFGNQDPMSATKQDKLEMSVVNFKIANPDWTPPDNEVFEGLNSFIDNAIQQKKATKPQQQHSNTGTHNPPSLNLNDIENMHDSNFVPEKVLNMVLGNQDEEDSTAGSSQETVIQNNNNKKFKMDTKTINYMNDLQQSYFDSQIFLGSGDKQYQLPTDNEYV